MTKYKSVQTKEEMNKASVAVEEINSGLPSWTHKTQRQPSADRSLWDFILSMANYESKERLRRSTDFLKHWPDRPMTRRTKKRCSVTLISCSCERARISGCLIVGLRKTSFTQEICRRFEERGRLFYVGITRAMKELCYHHTRTV